MKKLLSILASTSIIATTGLNVVACDTGSKPKPDDRIIEGNIGPTEGDDESIIKNLNVVADRHWTKEQMVAAGSTGKILDSKNVTAEDVIEGINWMNNTAITPEDVDVKMDVDKNMAIVTAKEGSKFYGTNNFLFNKQVNFEEFIKTADLGDIYLPESLPFPPTNPKKGLNVLPALTLLMEFVGDRNRALELVVDVVAKLSFNIGLAGIIPGNPATKWVTISEDNASVKLVENGLMEGQIIFKYKKNVDNRPEIADLIKVTDLGKLSTKSDEDIIKAVYKANVKTLKKYGEAEILDALEVFSEKDKTYVQFKAGNNKFRGHDPASFTIINTNLASEDKFREEDYQLPITFS
ncbi:lipoprotein [Spiroplasma endosymbiont of Panorpa germanica]|uniref:lipoprotein n=1 Tax=Spiroplasma endosymbiont of Panorpa germanica TaxID=3066314 RepID=UPI0030D2DA4B